MIYGGFNKLAPLWFQTFQLKALGAFTLITNTWLASAGLLKTIVPVTLFNSAPVTFITLVPVFKFTLICPAVKTLDMVVPFRSPLRLVNSILVAKADIFFELDCKALKAAEKSARPGWQTGLF